MGQSRDTGHVQPEDSWKPMKEERKATDSRNPLWALCEAGGISWNLSPREALGLRQQEGPITAALTSNPDWEADARPFIKDPQCRHFLSLLFGRNFKLTE